MCACMHAYAIFNSDSASASYKHWFTKFTLSSNGMPLKKIFIYKAFSPKDTFYKKKKLHDCYLKKQNVNLLLHSAFSFVFYFVI